MTLLVFLIIVLPFTLLMVSLASEVVDGYHRMEEMIKTGQLQAYLERMKEIPILTVRPTYRSFANGPYATIIKKPPKDQHFYL